MARSKSSKGLKDRAYLEFIRSLPCVICDDCFGLGLGDPRGFIIEQETRTEAAHCGHRGLSQKADDRTAVPLCSRHHRTGKDAHHVLGRGFWQHHAIDRDRLITALNETYERRNTQ